MINKAKLKSVMALNQDTGLTLAKALGISSSTLSAKINEYKGAEFTQREIKICKDRYVLSPEEVDSIFFTR